MLPDVLSLPFDFIFRGLPQWYHAPVPTVPTKSQVAKETTLSQRDRFGLVTWTLGILLGVGLCFAGGMAALVYWKESTPHYEAGALGDLEALLQIEANFWSNKHAYSVDFLELGVPLGAHANSNQLTFDYGYVFEFSNVIRDVSGKVTSYSMIARPVEYKRGTKHSYLLDSDGEIFATEEHRPATIHDRKLK